MSRTMPSECPHGYIYDWGDFGCQCDQYVNPDVNDAECECGHDVSCHQINARPGFRYPDYCNGFPEYCPEGCNEHSPEVQNAPEGFKVPQRADLLWLGIDLDGTLAEPLWTPANPHAGIGAPIQRNVAKLRAAVEAGYKVVVHTSRPDSDYELIEAWLQLHDIPFKAIRTGKPLCALYIDDRARHSEEESWLPPTASTS